MSPQFTDFMQRTEKVIVTIEKIAAILLFSTMVLAVLAKILLRNFLGESGAVDWVDSISSMLPHGVMILGFLGASLGISRFETIHIDLLNRLYPDSIKALVARLLYVLVALLGVLFIWLAWQSAEFLEKGYIFFGYIPGLFLITLKAIFRLILGAGESTPLV